MGNRLIRKADDVSFILPSYGYPESACKYRSVSSQILFEINLQIFYNAYLSDWRNLKSNQEMAGRFYDPPSSASSERYYRASTYYCEELFVIWIYL